MIADLPDIHVNNQIGMPNYSKQSYVNTLSDRRNSSGNGFRFPSQRNQGSVNQVKSKQSYSLGNSPVRGFNENQDQEQVVRTPVVTRRTEATTPRAAVLNLWATDLSPLVGRGPLPGGPRPRLGMEKFF